MARHYPQSHGSSRSWSCSSSASWRSSSVNALADALSAAADGARIYPNRVHGLLAGDATRSINTATARGDRGGVGSPRAAGRRNADCAWQIQQALPRRPLALPTSSRPPTGLRSSCDVRRPSVCTPWRMWRRHAASTGVIAIAAAPDWSWQDDAVKRSRRSQEGSEPQGGAVVPTGGGKTKISLPHHLAVARRERARRQRRPVGHSPNTPEDAGAPRPATTTRRDPRHPRGGSRALR